MIRNRAQFRNDRAAPYALSIAKVGGGPIGERPHQSNHKVYPVGAKVASGQWSLPMLVSVGNVIFHFRAFHVRDSVTPQHRCMVLTSHALPSHDQGASAGQARPLANSQSDSNQSWQRSVARAIPPTSRLYRLFPLHPLLCCQQHPPLHYQVCRLISAWHRVEWAAPRPVRQRLLAHQQACPGLFGDTDRSGSSVEAASGWLR